MLGLFQCAGSLHTLILSVQLGLCSTSKARRLLGFFFLWEQKYGWINWNWREIEYFCSDLLFARLCQPHLFCDSVDPICVVTELYKLLECVVYFATSALLLSPRGLFDPQ